MFMKNEFFKNDIFFGAIKEMDQIIWFQKELLLPVAFRILLMATAILTVRMILACQNNGVERRCYFSWRGYYNIIMIICLC